MGAKWDGGDVAFDPDTWRAVLRVLKPGAHLHGVRLAPAPRISPHGLRHRGCRVRDTGQPMLAVGFGISEKLLDVSLAIDRAAGAVREVVGQHERADLSGRGKCGLSQPWMGCSTSNAGRSTSPPRTTPGKLPPALTAWGHRAEAEP